MDRPYPPTGIWVVVHPGRARTSQTDQSSIVMGRSRAAREPRPPQAQSVRLVGIAAASSPCSLVRPTARSLGRIADRCMTLCLYNTSNSSATEEKPRTSASEMLGAVGRHAVARLTGRKTGASVPATPRTRSDCESGSVSGFGSSWLTCAPRMTPMCAI